MPEVGEGRVRKPHVVLRSATLTLVILGLLSVQALAVPSPTAGQESGLRTPVADGAATAVEAATIPSGITPLIGDFDGDHRSDVFMYGPGGLPDHVWLGRPDRAFRGAAANVGRGYVPLVGDFNGNGQRSVLVRAGTSLTCSGMARPMAAFSGYGR